MNEQMNEKKNEQMTAHLDYKGTVSDKGRFSRSESQNQEATPPQMTFTIITLSPLSYFHPFDEDKCILSEKTGVIKHCST